MKSGIYAIINKNNSRLYIGATSNLFDRKKRHFGDLMKNNHWNEELQNDYINGDEFIFDILEYCEIDKLSERESWFIKNSKRNLYNLEMSGKHHMHTNETKALISKKTSGENNGFYGKKHTEDNRKIMAEASRKWSEENKGENHPQFGTKIPLDRKIKIAKKLLTLSDNDLFKIKEMLLENTGESFRQKYLRIAPLFNVSDTLIKKIKMGKHLYALNLLNGSYDDWIKE